MKSAPASARPLLRSLWTAAGTKEPLTSLRALMEPEFTWSFGGDASADQAVDAWKKDTSVLRELRAALAGACARHEGVVTCAAKSGPRVVVEQRDGCWRWTAFVGGD